MNSYNLTLAEPVPDFLIGDVQGKLAYLDRRVTAARLDPSGKSVTLTTLTPLDEAAQRELLELAGRLIASMTEDAFEPEIKVIEARSGAMSYRDNPMPALVAQGELIEEGVGFYAIGPLLTSVIEFVSRRTIEIADQLSAKRYRFPALINPTYLEKVKYFTNFPHSLSFVTHLNENLIDIERFAAEAHCEDGHVCSSSELFSRPAAMLSPTVCHHLYYGLENRTLGRGLVATAEGNCFRFEARNMHSLERVWNFTMREIIFVGDDTHVANGLVAVRQAFAAVLDELDLTYRVVTANDPFFVGTFRDQAAYQAAFELKFEIRANVPHRGNTLAVGSFNRHGDFFGRTLNIKLHNGEFATTGCFGVGFERIAFALVSQHGPDPKCWPSRLRRAISRLPV